MKPVSAVADQFFNGQSDVAGDLAEQRRGDVAALVEGNRGAAAIGVPVLNMRTALADDDKTEAFQEPANLGGFENGNRPHGQATATFWVPTNSASRVGSPSSSSMEITSRRLALSSSSVSPWEWAPGKPGTYPTSKPVTGSRSMTAVKVFMAVFFHTSAQSQPANSMRNSHD